MFSARAGTALRLNVSEFSRSGLWDQCLRSWVLGFEVLCASRLWGNFGSECEIVKLRSATGTVGVDDGFRV